MPLRQTLSFLSDYGLADEFVAVVKSVVLAAAPDVRIVDITHEVPAFDVRSASLTLARSAPYLCPGVVLAVVDPGVGSDRRGIAVEVGDGETVLVGPDNGLLAPVVAIVGGATRAAVLDRPEAWLQTPTGTFDGRDIFAPVAARLCNGADLAEVGTLIDPASLTPALVPFSSVDNGVINAEVIWVDRYGNAQLNVSPGQADHFGERFGLTAGSANHQVRRVRTFSDLTGNELGAIVDSSGLIAIVRDQASAADHGLLTGTSVTLTPLDS